MWPWNSRSITPQMIGILTKVFFKYVSNLVILAWTADELWCKQMIDTHTLTDTQTWAMTKPEGQNWPGVNIISIVFILYKCVICCKLMKVNVCVICVRNPVVLYSWKAKQSCDEFLITNIFLLQLTILGTTSASGFLSLLNPVKLS